MFTGIIEEQGTVTAREASGDGIRLTLRAPLAVSDAGLGDSIAVNGTCLTVAERTDDTFTADVMKQTLDVTTLGELAVGDPVNLERAMAAGTRLGGHIVQGHIDGTGTVREVRPGDEWQVVRIAVPDDLAPLIVDKGSITVDGVSLTVSAASEPGEPGWLEVSLIPETLRVTTLGAIEVGDVVNLETDVLARHVRRLLSFSHEQGVTP